MSDLQSDEKAAVGWVKTHTLLAACLACFIVGVALGHFFHPFK
jgi:hypothetical protein